MLKFFYEVHRDCAYSRLCNSSCMIKKEATNKMTDVRYIECPNDAFLVSCGMFSSPMEHATTVRFANGEPDFSRGAPYMIKGLSLDERVRKLNYLEAQDYTLYIALDQSRYDVHQDDPLISETENIYLQVPFTGEEPYHDMYTHCIESKVQQASTLWGLSFTYRRKRRTGENVTSLANGTNNFILLSAIFGGEEFADKLIIVEGDDALIGFRGVTIDQVKSRLAWYAPLGLRVKLDEVADSIEGVGFCGTRFAIGPDGKIEMFGDIPRCLAKFHTTTSNMSLQRLLVAKCLSRYYTDVNTPIIGEMCYSILIILGSQTGFKNVFRLAKAEDRYSLREDRQYRNFLRRVQKKVELNPPRVSMQARIVAESTFGISVSTQLRIEKFWRDAVAGGVIPSKVPKLQVSFNVKSHAIMEDEAAALLQSCN